MLKAVEKFNAQGQQGSKSADPATTIFIDLLLAGTQLVMHPISPQKAHSNKNLAISPKHTPNIFAPPQPINLFPKLFRECPINPGYQAAHAFYDEIREQFSKLAYAPGSTGEVVSVMARLKMVSETCKNGMQVSVREFHQSY